MIQAHAVRILVLSRNRRLYSTRRLLEAARAVGHEAAVIDPMECWLVCGDGAYLHHKSRRHKLEDFDVVLPRIGSSMGEFGLGVVQQIETIGIPVVNGAEAIRRSRDKFRSLQLLAEHGIAIPKTAIVRAAGQIPAALHAVGGLPVVLKLRQGTQGIGVMLAESLEALESILHALWSLGQDLLVQELIRESRGRDVRVLVAGGRVVAAMRRTAPPGDFRSNIHRGGSGRALQLTGEYERVAIEAVRVMGLGVAGVDLLESRSGPKVIEVNSSPGLEGLEKATRADLAAELIRHAGTHASALTLPNPDYIVRALREGGVA